MEPQDIEPFKFVVRIGGTRDAPGLVWSDNVAGDGIYGTRRVASAGYPGPEPVRRAGPVACRLEGPE